MTTRKAAGVHHVGFGVRDLEGARTFYRGVLGFTSLWDQWEHQYNVMADTFRNAPHDFGGSMFRQEAGGLILEPILKHYPTPRPIRNPPRYGDLGVNKITFAVADVDVFFRDAGGSISFIGTPQSTILPGIGDYRFVYGRDPEGNLLEFASREGVDFKGNQFGGALSVGISVSDLERSTAFYRDHWDFDLAVSEHEAFSGLVGELTGSSESVVKTCLLDSSTRRDGGMLELYEVDRPRGRSMPFGTQWGDFGYMEICLTSLGNALDIQKYCIEEGLEVIQRPTKFSVSPDGTREYWFLYVLDPDGVFVEQGTAHRVKGPA